MAVVVMDHHARRTGHLLASFVRDTGRVRADRLVATLLFLQSRGRVTAAEVAEELEVSERTARRDLEALAMAGIPVYSQAGRGGGWSLVGGARTDLSGLTAAEARTLFLVAGPSSSVTPEAKAALRKLVQALPETFRAEAEAAASAIVLDPARWGRHRAAAAAPPRRAAAGRRGRRAGAAGLRRPRARRDRAHRPPARPRRQGHVWYLVADTEAGQRTFRVCRVRSVELTDRPAERPAGFDLAETWQSVVATVDERRSWYRVTVRAPLWALPMLRAQFGGVRELEGDGAEADRVDVELGGASAAMMAEQLAGWGHHLEVVGPEEVRRRLAEIGAALVARYALDPGPDEGRGVTAAVGAL